MLTSKSLFAATFACVCLFATTPAVDARPGPTNPFSHPVQAFRWCADQHVQEATQSIHQASLASAWSVMNPSSRMVNGRPGEALQNGASGITQIDSIASGFISVINAEASIVRSDLLTAGETELADAVESARADAVQQIEAAATLGKARVNAAMQKLVRKNGGGLDTQPRSKTRGKHGTTANVGDAL